VSALLVCAAVDRARGRGGADQEHHRHGLLYQRHTWQVQDLHSGVELQAGAGDYVPEVHAVGRVRDGAELYYVR